MKKSSLLITLSVLSMAALTGQVFAQAAAPAAPAAPALPTPPTFGAPLAGQCVLDTSEAMANSAMGKAAVARLQQLQGVVDSELAPDSTALDTEYKSLSDQQKAATAPTATAAVKQAFAAKAQGWEQKRQAFQEKSQQRSQEMQYTQQGVMQAVFQKMIPQINAVVTAKGCSTVVAADSLLHYSVNGANNQPSTFVYVNPAMDITSAVVQKLDATGELLPTFQRADLSQQGGAPAQ